MKSSEAETGGFEKRKEKEKKLSREADKLGRWGKSLETVRDWRWPLAHGSARTGTWCHMLLGCREAGVMPSLCKVSPNPSEWPAVLGSPGYL